MNDGCLPFDPLTSHDDPWDALEKGMCASTSGLSPDFLSNRNLLAHYPDCDLPVNDFIERTSYLLDFNSDTEGYDSVSFSDRRELMRREDAEHYRKKDETNVVEVSRDSETGFSSRASSTTGKSKREEDQEATKAMPLPLTAPSRRRSSSDTSHRSIDMPKTGTVERNRKSEEKGKLFDQKIVVCESVNLEGDKVSAMDASLLTEEDAPTADKGDSEDPMTVVERKRRGPKSKKIKNNESAETNSLPKSSNHSPTKAGEASSSRPNNNLQQWQRNNTITSNNNKNKAKTENKTKQLKVVIPQFDLESDFPPLGSASNSRSTNASSSPSKKTPSEKPSATNTPVTGSASTVTSPRNTVTKDIAYSSVVLANASTSLNGSRSQSPTLSSSNGSVQSAPVTAWNKPFPVSSQPPKVSIASSSKTWPKIKSSPVPPIDDKAEEAQSPENEPIVDHKIGEDEQNALDETAETPEEVSSSPSEINVETPVNDVAELEENSPSPAVELQSSETLSSPTSTSPPADPVVEKSESVNDTPASSTSTNVPQAHYPRRPPAPSGYHQAKKYFNYDRLHYPPLRPTYNNHNHMMRHLKQNNNPYNRRNGYPHQPEYYPYYLPCYYKDGQTYFVSHPLDHPVVMSVPQNPPQMLPLMPFPLGPPLPGMPRPAFPFMPMPTLNQIPFQPAEPRRDPNAPVEAITLTEQEEEEERRDTAFRIAAAAHAEAVAVIQAHNAAQKVVADSKIGENTSPFTDSAVLHSDMMPEADITLGNLVAENRDERYEAQDQDDISSLVENNPAEDKVILSNDSSTPVSPPKLVRDNRSKGKKKKVQQHVSSDENLDADQPSENGDNSTKPSDAYTESPTQTGSSNYDSVGPPLSAYPYITTFANTLLFSSELQQVFRDALGLQPDEGIFTIQTSCGNKPNRTIRCILHDTTPMEIMDHHPSMMWIQPTLNNPNYVSSKGYYYAQREIMPDPLSPGSTRLITRHYPITSLSGTAQNPMPGIQNFFPTLIDIPAYPPSFIPTGPPLAVNPRPRQSISSFPPQPGPSFSYPRTDPIHFASHLSPDNMFPTAPVFESSTNEFPVVASPASQNQPSDSTNVNFFNEADPRER